MIPVMIIGGNVYANYTKPREVIELIEYELPMASTHDVFDYPNMQKENEKIEKENLKQSQLRNKVFELLHEEVAECFRYNLNSGNYPQEVPALEQINFQIYLKDIIEKARKELK